MAPAWGGLQVLSALSRAWVKVQEGTDVWSGGRGGARGGGPRIQGTGAGFDSSNLVTPSLSGYLWTSPTESLELDTRVGVDLPLWSSFSGIHLTSSFLNRNYLC